MVMIDGDNKAEMMDKLYDTQCPNCNKWWMSDLLKDSTYIRHYCPSCRERSKREDFYLSLAKEYLDGKEHWETDPSEKISIKCFASWLDRRCGALNIVETQ